MKHGNLLSIFLGLLQAPCEISKIGESCHLADDDDEQDFVLKVYVVTLN